jgi:hypothetical protein
MVMVPLGSVDEPGPALCIPRTPHVRVRRIVARAGRVVIRYVHFAQASARSSARRHQFTGEGLGTISRP